MGKTSIGWTDYTWQPVRGCRKVSPGCEHCYAMRQAHRANVPGGAYEGLTKQTAHGPEWTGTARPEPGELRTPYRWRTPRRVFVCSMADLFHEDVPDAHIAEVWATMAATPQHTYQVLTKRPARMAAWLNGPARADTWRVLDGRVWERTQTKAHFAGNLTGQMAISQNMTGWPLSNVWIGTSVEDQPRANERVPELLKAPAAVRWLSIEPMLGPVNPWGWPCPGSPCVCHERIDWIVAGGESGAGARPCDPDWARSLRDQCVADGIPFFWKQWGNWLPEDQELPIGREPLRIGTLYDWPQDRPRHAVLGAGDWPPQVASSIRMPKHLAGNRLDGVVWEQFPKVSA